MTRVNKLTPHSDGKRRKMSMTKLTAVALTARGANPEAHVTFFKSHKGGEASVEKRMALVTMEALHDHSISIDDFTKVHGGGDTGWSDDHSHSFVIEEDGTITIGATKGHTHFMMKTVEEITKHGLSEEQMLFVKSQPAADNGGPQSANEDNTMTDAEKAAKKAQDEISSLKKSLATAVAIGSMNDGQRAIFKSLTGDAQDEFLAKSDEDREAIVKAAVAKAADENAVVYKSHDGTEFFKSDDPRMIKMAQDGDIRDAKLEKAEAKAADSEVAKRAGDLFKNLSGDLDTHAALLKAVDGIENVDLRKNVMETLAKQDAGISAILETHGTQTVGVSDGDAEAKLDTLAKAYVTAHPEVNYFDAYSIVSDANADLLKKAVG